MKTMRISLALLLLCSSAVPYTYTQESSFSKKLQKVWENNWVKAGIITATCATVYAISARMGAAAPACTGKPGCSACSDSTILGVLGSNRLVWNALTAISGVAALAFGYAWFNSQQEESPVNTTTASGSQTNTQEAASHEFGDDFFAIPTTPEVPAVTNNPITPVVADVEETVTETIEQVGEELCSTVDTVVETITDTIMADDNQSTLPIEIPTLPEVSNPQELPQTEEVPAAFVITELNDTPMIEHISADEVQSITDSVETIIENVEDALNTITIQNNPLSLEQNVPAVIPNIQHIAPTFL